MNDQEPQKLSEAEPKTNHIVETEPQTQLPEQEQKKQKAFMKSLRAIIGLCLLVVFFFFLFLPEIKKLFTRPADKKILTEQLGLLRDV